jgi:hypothetical protein
VVLVAQEFLKNQKVHSPQSSKWRISNGVLQFCSKIIVL